MNNDDIKSGLAELENIFIDYKTKSANGTKKVLNGDFCDWNVNNKGKQLLRYIADSVRGRVLTDLKKNVFSGMTKNSFDKKGEVPIKPYSRYDFMSKEEKEKFGVTLYASYNFGMPEAESFEFAIKLDVEENNPPEKALIENFKELEDFIGK
ncbi:MAG: hypothetical protein IKZ97_07535, partial [Butyrivibrio sp.]|nr:hypothetical protein [Butyrivibrio sp.]